MLSARAYSFRQKSRLAISLSWVAGFVNVVALIAMGSAASHVTGTTTQLGHWLGAGDWMQAAFFAYVLGCFSFGAVVSAFTTETARRRGWRSKYVLPIGIETFLLSMLILVLQKHGTHVAGWHLFEAAGLAAVAMGLQNAAITRISGSVVRTTHVTGIFTDLGIEGVQYLFWWKDHLAAKRRGERAGRLLKLSRRHPTALRLLLLLSIAGSFGFGAAVGAFAFGRLGPDALLIPASFLLWIILVDWRMPISDIRELDLTRDPELPMLSVIKQLLPREVVFYRAWTLRGGTVHRAPNFQLWLDRVPAHCRVLVLVISPLTRFDTNAVMDLEAAVRRLHQEGRTLVIAGVTMLQFKALDALGVTQMMDPTNLCPDLEFAVARAVVIMEEQRHPYPPRLRTA